LAVHRASYVLWVALLGCGRLGFEERDGPGGTGGPITAVVTSDESAAGPAGQPIRGATVLIERGGTIERTATDDAGTVQFSSTGVTVYHVVYQTGQQWRIYTVAASLADVVELGGRAASTPDRQMMLSVPAVGGQNRVTATMPDQCGVLGDYGTSSWQFTYNAACEGKAVRMLVFRLDAGARTSGYIDAGMVTLARGSSHTVSGTYAAISTPTVQITNLPNGTTNVAATFVARVGVDLTRLSHEIGTAFPQGSSATVTTTAAAGGDAIVITAAGPFSQYSTSSQRVVPIVGGGPIAVDAAQMLPLYGALTVTHLPMLSWNGVDDSGTLVAVQASSFGVEWDAYLERSAATVTLPAFPLDLPIAIPSVFDRVIVTKLGIPGADAATLARTIDRTWQAWPSHADLLPAETSSMTRIMYDSGLGPP
jgi:hypothetical protein